MTRTALAALPPIPESNKALPVEYSAAVKAIAACRTFDAAREWSDKADALAAWAKIYADDKIEREARSLKLYAYRRIGDIAKQLRPEGYRKVRGSSGPHKLLMEKGFNKTKASDIMKISRMPAQEFEAVATSPRPPSPSVLVHQKLRPNPEWAELSQRLHMALSGMRKTEPKKVAATLTDRDADSAYKACREMLYFLVPFHDALKAKLKL